MTAIVAAGAVAVALAVVGYLRGRFVLVAVHGDSMVPALADGDRVLVDRKAPGITPGRLVVARKPSPGLRWADPEPGPSGPASWVVKRVAAAGPAPGTFVLLGDNAARSWDSRQWGPCPADRVLGVVVRVFPRPAVGAGQASASSRART